MDFDKERDIGQVVQELHQASILTIHVVTYIVHMFLSQTTLRVGGGREWGEMEVEGK